MDPFMNDFSFQQFSATSTPMTTSMSQSQKKRPLLKEKNGTTFPSPASKKSQNASEESSNETMPDLFFYDKKSTDQFSFEDVGQENLQKKLSSVEEATSCSNSVKSGDIVDSSLSPISVKNDEQYIPKRIISSDVDETILSPVTAMEGEKLQVAHSPSVTTDEEHLSVGHNSSVTTAEEEEPKVEHSPSVATDEEDPDEHSPSVATDEEDPDVEHSPSVATDEEKSNEEDIETVDDSHNGNANESESVLIDEDEKSIELISDKIEVRKKDPISGTSHPTNLPRTKLISPPNIASTMHGQLGRLFGGKMTDERLQKISTISNDVINAMHSSLSTLPENVQTNSPNGLRVDLLVHQKTGLTWLLWREQQIPPSGILADEMGLGKTLAMISLILHKKNARKTDSEEMLRTDKQLRRKYTEDSYLTPANSTLVIAPASLIFQWEKEVRDRVRGDLKVHVFHGPKQKRAISVERLIKYDIVITTYDTLVSELKKQRMNLIGANESDDKMAGSSHGKRMSRKFTRASSSVLAKIAWERIILDEAHEIRNKNSLKFHCCCDLEAVHRWCLTGTPIHNKVWDLFSLIHFLRIAPFSEEKMWKEFIATSSATSGQRLNVIVKNVLLRRTKSQICPETDRPIVDLPPKNYELVTLKFQKLEQHCYSVMFEASKQKVRELLRDGALGGHGGHRRFRTGAKIKNPFVGGGARMAVDGNFKAYSCILSLLLRLRQACVHLSLTRKAIDIDAFKDDESEREADDEADNLAAKVLEMSMAQLSLDEDELEAEGNGGRSENGHQIEKLFNREHQSTKVCALMERLSEAIQHGDKCVVVSQWTSMLAIIEFHLRQQSISYTSITGEVRTEERQSRVDIFNRVGMGPKVMLLSLTAGGVGLNLTGGNHLFLVDLHWNPALELQASDRIHRLGQTKDVFIHKFVCDSTIEQRVFELQEKKKAMATSVLEGAAKKLGNLSKDDVMYLFELEKRPNTQQNGGQSQKPTTSSQV